MGWGGHLNAEEPRQLQPSSLNLPCGGLIIILIVLSTVNLLRQGFLVPISLRLVLRLCKMEKCMSWLQPGHHVANFFHW